MSRPGMTAGRSPGSTTASGAATVTRDLTCSAYVRTAQAAPAQTANHASRAKVLAGSPGQGRAPPRPKAPAMPRNRAQRRNQAHLLADLERVLRPARRATVLGYA